MIRLNDYYRKKIRPRFKQEDGNLYDSACEGEILRVKSRVNFGHVNTMPCEFREVQSGG